MRIRAFVLVELVIVAIGVLTFSARVLAQQFWIGGTGTWDTTTPNWGNAPGVGGSVYNTSTPVIFSGAAGVVTIGSNITTNNISVSFAVDGYVINSNGFELNAVSNLPVGVGAGLNATINAPVTGSANLLKFVGGTLILTGVNTYSGITGINTGVLSISQDANLGTPPDEPVANKVSLQGGIDGGTLQATASFPLNANRGIVLVSGGGMIDVTGDNVLRYDGVISGAGEGSVNLSKIGTGTLVLSGSNTYSGTTFINAGVLSISQDANLGTPVRQPARLQWWHAAGNVDFHPQPESRHHAQPGWRNIRCHRGQCAHIWWCDCGCRRSDEDRHGNAGTLGRQHLLGPDCD